MKSYLGPVVLHGYLKVGLFAIPIGHGEVYMRSEGLDEDFVVAEVKTMRLFELWRASPYGGNKYLAHGTPQSWLKDYKFGEAEARFAEGRLNPVPIPRIECAVSERGESFIEVMDVTRTIWLAANAAPYIPVTCEPGQINLLAHVTDTPRNCWSRSSGLLAGFRNCSPQP